MKKFCLFAIVSLFTVLVSICVSPKSVYSIADPDSAPQVNAVYVYEDLLEDGDVGVFVDYYLNYGTTPSETVTEAYLVIFIDIDGVTQLDSVSPYTFHNSGYGRGLAWIYFSAAEVTTYGLTSVNEALYDIWLVGNPTVESGWAGDPPRTIAGIDEWYTTGDSSVLLALRVLYYADLLEVIWSPLDLIEVTSVGNRLTATGESYFENVITDLRTMAPACFSATVLEPTLEDIDYTTTFGATATSTVLAGSPVTLTAGTNNLNPTGAGTITFTLVQGTEGTVTGAVVTGSPLTIVAGTNTATITGAGAIVVVVNQQDTTTAIDTLIRGTGWDLETIANTFGVSRWMFSGILWMIISVIICTGTFGGQSKYGTFSGDAKGKTVMIVFDICIVAGTLLGFLKPVVGILLFIGFGAFTGYMLFFRGSSV